ncbi:YcbK family protein [Minwuia thermotolerans]|uniref:Murein endopeptidase K n=1 Tax=Minwuia thermotolerans TaxID=2056226 RepID=A0A2M9FYM1_9PROT|nr:YcbK family protein [Minwuia thermotolerans]PJK28554.1 Twin-arginine translocation pathway signal [Minwuia thermotolerans]
MNDTHDGDVRDVPRAPAIARRVFLGGLGAAALTAGFGLPSGAALAAQPVARSLSFNNLHTGERLKTVFQEHGQFDPAALGEINHLLRDHRTGDVEDIDPRLLVLLSDLRHKLGSKSPFQVISGYRSPKTNAMLASNSSGVAKKSYHMRGMAIDCYLPDVDLRKLHKAALQQRGGGVGLYARSGFVHLDVGRVRSW